MAVGIHPKHASKVGDRDVDRVASLVCGGGVTAIGEMGLDFSVPSDRWPAQRSLLRAQLRLVGPGRVLILHLRGTTSDKLGTIPSQECRNMLLSAVTRYQRIHLHCCTLGPGETEAWRKAFPHVYFGYSPMVRLFTPDQQAALRRVPRDRLLLETDSPHFAPEGVRVNTPAYIGEVAEMVAEARRETVHDVLELTARNGLFLYGRR